MMLHMVTTIGSETCSTINSIQSLYTTGLFQIIDPLLYLLTILYTISQTLGFVLFEKIPINQLFNKNQNSVSTDEYPNLFSMS